MHSKLLTTRFLPLTWVEYLVESRWFNILVFAIILMNTAFVGFTSDWSMRRAIASYHDESPDEYADILRSNQILAVEFFFLSAFILELMLRILAYEGNFCFGPDWGWNVFDTVVVLMSAIESVMLVVGFSSTYIRVLRFTKIVRPARMLRLLRWFPLVSKLRALTLAFTRCRVAGGSWVCRCCCCHFSLFFCE